MSGAAKTLISPEEYLSVSFGDREPECVRGELIYKPAPDSFQWSIEAALVRLLMNALRTRGFRVMVKALTLPEYGLEIRLEQLIEGLSLPS